MPKLFISLVLTGPADNISVTIIISMGLTLPADNISVTIH